MGETRETRINEFHTYNTQPVVGLREGSWIEVLGNEITLKGKENSRVFEYNKKPIEMKPETTISHLK
jgi:dipeptidase E